MTSRGFVLGIAMLLALAATAAVAVYVRGIEERSEKAENMVQVIVAKEDIIAGERLDELLARGAFKTDSVAEDSLVENAITSLDQLEGKTTSSPIIAGEQVSAARLEGSGALPGGTLGIPTGYTAVNVALPAPAVVGGEITSGDHVAVYANFGEVDGGKVKNAAGGLTVNLIPDAQVLRVVGVIPGSSGALGSTSRYSDIELGVTMALKPRDAEKLIYAKGQGEIHLALIPPGEKGQKQSPMTLGEVAN